MKGHKTTFAALIAASLTTSAAGQVVMKPDGRWRYAVSASLTSATGNSRSLAYALNADAGYQDASRKINLYANGAYGKNDGEVSTHNLGVGNRWNWELSARPWFLFGQGDYNRDRLANLSSRIAVNGGLGYHVWRRNDDFWDLSAGLGYSHDEYAEPTIVADELRTRYGRFETIFASESQHATFKQRLALLPSLAERGEYRAIFDASLSVSMTSRLALTATLSVRRNSDPGTGVKKNDTLFITGVTWRVE
jgi:putative salt-induced outer membrane protein